jgi:pimeloyl-ACP methyl ester carboxylesterase
MPRAARPATVPRLRGALRLAVEGIHGVTHIAQGLHGSIARLAPPVGKGRERPAGGIAGLVYGAVRLGSSVVGKGLDAALDLVEARLDTTAGPDDSRRRDAIVAALNGVLGDHLARTDNPLAIPMELVVKGPARPRVLLLVHGLCMNDAGWTRNGHDHGAALAAALDCTPVYLRYNSGLHVSENGAELARQLETLLAQWPVPVQDLTILGHSMGGLVARSAVEQARRAGLSWPGALHRMVFLGTPHHGAALERGGNWLHAVLDASPYLAPFARLGRLRSDGITDLRFGNLLQSDWQAGPHLHRDTRVPVPLPAGVACFAIAGAVANGRAGAVLGDGLVAVDSALGRHADARRTLRLPQAHTFIATGVHHLDLLSDAGVADRLATWLR